MAGEGDAAARGEAAGEQPPPGYVLAAADDVAVPPRARRVSPGGGARRPTPPPALRAVSPGGGARVSPPPPPPPARPDLLERDEVCRFEKNKKANERAHKGKGWKACAKEPEKGLEGARGGGEFVGAEVTPVDHQPVIGGAGNFSVDLVVRVEGWGVQTGEVGLEAKVTDAGIIVRGVCVDSGLQ